MIPPFVATWFANNAIRLAFIAGAIAFVSITLYTIYNDGYNTGYRKMEELHNAEVAKSREEVANVLALNAKLHTEKLAKIDKTYKELNDVREKENKELTTKYNDAVNRGLFISRENRTGSSSSGSSQTKSVYKDNRSDREGLQDRLDTKTTAAILETGRLMQESINECHKLLESTRPYIEVVE